MPRFEPLPVPDFLAGLRDALRTTSWEEKLHRHCVLVERAFERRTPELTSRARQCLIV